MTFFRKYNFGDIFITVLEKKKKRVLKLSQFERSALMLEYIIYADLTDSKVKMKITGSDSWTTSFM